jgi:hypothetical protein
LAVITGRSERTWWCLGEWSGEALRTRILHPEETYMTVGLQ